MGATIEKAVVFPAPPSPMAQSASPHIVWDVQPPGTPGGGVRRPFLWLPALEATPRTLIYFHANAEDLSLVESWLETLRDGLGVNILAVEYPGYGLLRDPEDLQDWGVTTVEGIDDAAVQALRYLVLTRGIPCDQVLLHGRSLGSGPALRLAMYARDQLNWGVGAVVLQSPFLTLKRLACDHAGAVGSLLVRTNLDNLATLRQLCRGGAGAQVPLLILHGEMDDFIAPYHGRELFYEALRHGHPSAEASFPRHATHDGWDQHQDMIEPISKFMVKHMGSWPVDSGEPAARRMQLADLRDPSWGSPGQEFNKGLLDVLQGVLGMPTKMRGEQCGNDACFPPL